MYHRRQREPARAGEYKRLRKNDGKKAKLHNNNAKIIRSPTKSKRNPNEIRRKNSINMTGEPSMKGHITYRSRGVHGFRLAALASARRVVRRMQYSMYAPPTHILAHFSYTCITLLVHFCYIVREFVLQLSSGVRNTCFVHCCYICFTFLVIFLGFKFRQAVAPAHGAGGMSRGKNSVFHWENHVF